MKHRIHNVGLDSIPLTKAYAAGVLWAMLLAVILGKTGEFATFAAGLLAAGFLFAVSHIRDTYLEAHLRSSLEYAIDMAVSTFEEYRINVRNSTWVPITIRDIRLRGVPVQGKPRRILHFQFVSPSNCVINNDPDQGEINAIPSTCELPTSFKEITGLPLTDAQAHVTFSPNPGDFHEIPPEAGAVYAMNFIWCQEFLSLEIADCLMIVEYPTILGRTRVITVHSSKPSTAFIQSTLRTQIPWMKDQEKKVLEQAGRAYVSPEAGKTSAHP